MVSGIRVIGGTPKIDGEPAEWGFRFPMQSDRSVSCGPRRGGNRSTAPGPVLGGAKSAPAIGLSLWGSHSALPASSLQERPARNCVLQVRQFSALHIQDLATLGEPMARERKTASHPAEPIPTGIANDRYIWSINGCHHQRKAMARPAFARCFQRWRWRCPVACGEAETDGATIRSGHRRRSPLEKVRRTRMSSGSWELPD